MENENKEKVKMSIKKDSNNSQYLVPGAIVVAGVIVALAVVYASGGGATTATNQQGDAFGNNLSPTAEKIQPVDKNDHFFGGDSAKVTIVEFSDYECPFCSRLHPTLSQIVDDFGGEVGWVYRHFPLAQIHSQAVAGAVASECAASLGGNDAFWKFTDRIFQNQRALGIELYEQIAADLGISQDDFRTCLQSEDMLKLVQADLEDAVTSGGRGTPYVVVINEEGNVFPFSGALPYENVRAIVEQALEG